MGKRGFLWLLLFCSFALASCAPTPPPAPTATTPPLSPVEEWAAELKEKYGGTTLTLAVASHPSTEAFQKMTPRFEELTGIKVVWDVVEEAALADKVMLEWTAHTGRYDILMSCPEFTPGFADLGALEPLDPYLNNEREVKVPLWFDYDDIIPAYRQMLVYDGKIYAVPFAGESIFIAYRKDLFDQYGKTPPKSYDELLELAKFFHGKDDLAGVTFRARRGWEFTYQWSVFIFPFGGRIVDPATMKPTLDEPGTIRSLEYFISLKEFAPTGIESFSFPEAWDAFMTGKAAIMVEATAAAPEIENPEKSVVAGKVGYAPMPEGPAGGFSGVWGWGFSISSDSKNKDAAWALVLWLTSREMQDEYLAQGGIVTRTSGLSDLELQAIYPYYEAILATLQQASSLTEKGLGVVPACPQWMELSEIIGSEGSRAFIGEVSAEEACHNMQEQAAELFAE